MFLHAFECIVPSIGPFVRQSSNMVKDQWIYEPVASNILLNPCSGMLDAD